MFVSTSIVYNFMNDKVKKEGQGEVEGTVSATCARHVGP